MVTDFLSAENDKFSACRQIFPPIGWYFYDIEITFFFEVKSEIFNPYSHFQRTIFKEGEGLKRLPSSLTPVS